MLQAEYEFTLPKGYVDSEGNVHKNGVMRLAKARDEILPMKDPRVKSNPAYASVIVLARVITKLGEIDMLNPKVIEELYSEDFEHLQQLYRKINGYTESVLQVTCPHCNESFEVELTDPGGQ